MKLYRKLFVGSKTVGAGASMEKTGIFLSLNTKSHKLHKTTDFNGWTLLSSTVPTAVSKVVYLNNAYYAINTGSRIVYRSTDLINWINVYSFGPTWYLQDIKVVNGRLFIFGSTLTYTYTTPCATSADGITWVPVSIPAFKTTATANWAEVSDVIYVDGVYVFAGITNISSVNRFTMAKTTDLTVDAISLNTVIANVNTGLVHMAHDGANIYTIGSGGNGMLFKTDSLNPTSFSTVFTLSSPYNSFNGIDNIDDTNLIITSPISVSVYGKKGTGLQAVVSANMSIPAGTVFRANGYTAVGGGSYIYRSVGLFQTYDTLLYPDYPNTGNKLSFSQV